MSLSIVAAKPEDLAALHRPPRRNRRVAPEDPIVWPEDPAGEALYLHNLAVHRAHAGQSLGCQLLTWAEKHTANAGRRNLRLGCVASNQVRCRYYEKAGLKTRGEVESRFPNGAFRLHRFEKCV